LKDGIEIKVSDEGMGIPSSDLPHLFEPFFTTRPVGEGKGLGLNIVYRIITKYDGTIRVESKEKMGTTFIIQLPTRRDS
jgi:signal transduction histidine kinase